MSVRDDARCQRIAASHELRRLVTEGLPPGDLDLAAFGLWGEVIDLLRQSSAARGPAACRQLFFRLAATFPDLAELLPAVPRDFRWAVPEPCLADFPPPDESDV